MPALIRTNNLNRLIWTDGSDAGLRNTKYVLLLRAIGLVVLVREASLRNLSLSIYNFTFYYLFFIFIFTIFLFFLCKAQTDIKAITVLFKTIVYSSIGKWGVTKFSKNGRVNMALQRLALSLT